MPTISVDKADLFAALEKEYTTEEFDQLCFDFGIELDEDTSQTERPVVNGVQEPPQLKIEIPANRYDMLCFEGIALNLRVFLQKQNLPKFSLNPPPGGELQTIKVSPECERIRPLVSGAVLRNIKFDQKRYDSFIALQDKLHQNLARQRTLVSIGTHDLDTIQGPFTYEALPPEQIKFAPLNQTKEMDGKEMMEFYEKDKHLGRYLHIIRDSPVYPVIFDANRTVCSLPPIINGNHSKISINTKNVFIEITAIDKTKVEIVNQILVAMFSEYCEAIEPIKIVSDHNKETRETPDLTPRQMQAEVDYLNQVCGLDLAPQQNCEMLLKMGYEAKPSSEPGILDVSVPITRADILHQADIMEDMAIAYGFNNLPRGFQNKSSTVAAPLPVNKLSDIVRVEAAMAGWSESMPLILCSYDENFAWMNRKDDGKTGIRVGNPKSLETQMVRTSLVPGLLKTIRENKHHRLPMRVFEVSDVAHKDLSLERKSRNERHFAAAWYGKTSGFEVVHGLLDHIMRSMKADFITLDEGLKQEGPDGYWLKELEDPTFLKARAASIDVKVRGQTKQVGTLGILHPTVLKNFELVNPVSVLEMNLEVFL